MKSSTPHRPLRILIVEDEAVVLMQLETLAEDLGYEVVETAMSADEAIAKIIEHRPELVLLDLHLKDGSSGLDVARAVRAMDAVTIVFITANGRKLTDDLAGAAGFIAKPFNEKAMRGSLVFLEECMHRPPPRQDIPYSLKLAPSYLARLESGSPTRS